MPKYDRQKIASALLELAAHELEDAARPYSGTIDDGRVMAALEVVDRALELAAKREPKQKPATSPTRKTKKRKTKKARARKPKATSPATSLPDSVTGNVSL